MSSTITDPASEIAEMIKKIRGIESNESAMTPLWAVIAQGANVAGESTEMMEILAIIRTRLSRLSKHVIDYKGNDISREVKDRVLEILKRVATVFTPQHISMPWKDVVSRGLVKGDIVVIEMLGYAMRQYMPRRKLTDEERENTLIVIREALSELKENDELDQVKKEALIEGYQRVEFILRYFEYFGHEGLAQQAFVMAAAVNVASKDEKFRTRCKNTLDVMVRIATILTVVAAPAEAWTALTVYDHVLHSGIEMMYRVRAPTQLLLSGPAQAAIAPVPAEKREQGE